VISQVTSLGLKASGSSVIIIGTEPGRRSGRGRKQRRSFCEKFLTDPQDPEYVGMSNNREWEIVALNEHRLCRTRGR